jgi:serine protease
LVFIGDNGIELNHNALKSSALDGSGNAFYVGGGNFIPGLSYDLASQDSYSISPVWKMVDEIQPVPTVGGAPANCVGPPYIAQIAGHGTHVAGLIGGSALQTSDQSGGGCVCQEVQFNPVVFGVKPVAQGSGVNTSLSLASRLGAQVYNASFGLPNVEAAFCDPKGTNAPNNISCVALVRAERLQTLLVSATGNNRTRLQFNSNDARVTAVGGTSISGVSLWDESPAGTPGCNAGQPCYHGCPSYIPNIAFDNQVECGANWIPDGVLGFVEISTPAKSIRSLFYHGKTWNSVIACGDGFPAGSSASDGIGLCTGTSMTAPQASALFGLLRSINPLVPVGDPDDSSIALGSSHYGVRNVVAATASRANNRIDELGYGLPNAAAAAELMLGIVRAEPRTNRAIPLFRLYSAGAQDYATTAIPQVASAWSYTQTFSYSAVSANNSFIGSTPLLAFPSFLNDSTVVPQKPAAAFALVLSTHTSQIASFNTAPIFWVARRKVQGNQCDAISMQCNDSYDHALVDQSRLDSALQNGYEYRGYQGYVYVACDDAPTCNFIKPAPPGTQGLYVVCKPQVDCANTLSAELPAFAAQGYNQGWQGANTPSLIGYAYTAEDTDEDGLPNGAEIVAKTNPFDEHSDDDGIPDGEEYPFSGVPVSDPCDLGSSCAPPEFVHFNRFEAE